MYYPGCLAFTTSILNLQKEMNYDGIDPLQRLKFIEPDEEHILRLQKMFMQQIVKKCYKKHHNEIVSQVLKESQGVTMAKFFRSLEFESRHPEIRKIWEGITCFNFAKIAKTVFDQNFRQLAKIDDVWMAEVIEDLKAQNHEGCLRYLKSALVEGSLIALL